MSLRKKDIIKRYNYWLVPPKKDAEILLQPL